MFRLRLLLLLTLVLLALSGLYSSTIRASGFPAAGSIGVYRTDCFTVRRNPYRVNFAYFTEDSIGNETFHIYQYDCKTNQPVRRMYAPDLGGWLGDLELGGRLAVRGEGRFYLKIFSSGYWSIGKKGQQPDRFWVE